MNLEVHTIVQLFNNYKNNYLKVNLLFSIIIIYNNLCLISNTNNNSKFILVLNFYKKRNKINHKEILTEV